jgi:hypothetical protein
MVHFTSEALRAFPGPVMGYFLERWFQRKHDRTAIHAKKDNLEK